MDIYIYNYIYIYLHLVDFLMINVGNYTSSMDSVMGYGRT